MDPYLLVDKCVLLSLAWAGKPSRLVVPLLNSSRLIAHLVKNPPAVRETLVQSWVGKIPWRRDGLPTPVFLDFPSGSAGKESTHNMGDLGSIPGLRRSPGKGKSYPLRYSGLENSMDYTVHGVTKSRTRLRDFHFTSLQPMWQYILLLACLFYISFLHCRNISQINDLHGSLCLRLCSFGEARLIELVPRTARPSG